MRPIPPLGFVLARASILITALLLSPGCTSTPAALSVAPWEGAASTVTPPYYRIEGHGGATLLLMGTIHLGPVEGWNFSPALKDGIDEADSFIFEIDLREATDERVSTILANRVILPVSVTIEDVISPETAQLLNDHEVLLTELGLPELARRRLKPWFLAVSMIEVASLQSGYSGVYSAESQILVALEDRPLAGLETFEAQLAMFDDLSPRHQDLMLADTLSRLDQAVEDIDELARAWGRNDQQALEQIAYQGMNELPELKGFYDILFGERNRDWVLQLGQILRDPERAGETVFVAVGALHLVGPDSVIQMLEAEGYPAQPIHPQAEPPS